MNNDMERNKELLEHLEKQYPDPYVQNKWYNATLLNGKRVKILKTKGKGRNARTYYMHIEIPTIFAIITPAGEVVSRRRENFRCRMNMSTFEITVL